VIGCVAIPLAELLSHLWVGGRRKSSPEPSSWLMGGRRDLQPELYVADGPAAIDFYQEAFSAVVEHRVDGPGQGEVIAQLAAAGARFWVSSAAESLGRLSPDAIEGRTGRMLLVDEAPDSVLAAAVAAGATQTRAVGDEHGWRLGRFRDPFGHEWEVGHPLGAWPPS